MPSHTNWEQEVVRFVAVLRLVCIWGALAFFFSHPPPLRWELCHREHLRIKKSSLAKITTRLEIKHIAAAGLKLPRCPLCARMFLGNVRNAVGRWEPSRLRPHLG